MVRRALLSLLVLVTAAALAAGVVACGEQGSGGGRPRIVVTHAILGAVVSDLVGDAAEVRVLMPAGADPHDFRPSAKDIARLRDADLVVANGLGLEEGLDDALEQAKADGVPMFEATDHVTLRRSNGAADPHFWTDPSQMRAVVAALATVAKEQLGLDLSASARATDRRLRALDAEVERVLAPIPISRRKLVTGHESMGYFARRYGFTLVGAAVPGLSSQARVSASELAHLASVIEREGVTVVFAEKGTPRQVADAIADETGARVVELPSHALPENGSYEDLMRETARRIADALG
jgi:zinc/manganese transport system substrate-binding protein